MKNLRQYKTLKNQFPLSMFTIRIHFHYNKSSIKWNLSPSTTSPVYSSTGQSLSPSTPNPPKSLWPWTVQSKCFLCVYCSVMLLVVVITKSNWMWYWRISILEGIGFSGLQAPNIYLHHYVEFDDVEIWFDFWQHNYWWKILHCPQIKPMREILGFTYMSTCLV